MSRILVILSALFLSACTLNSTPKDSSDTGSSQESQSGQSSSESTSTSESSSSSSSEGGEITPSDNYLDAPILHCWNWSMNNTIANLQSIKNAGYKAIQLSPMQPQKDYYNDSISYGWWKLYQPLGFSVARANQNILGTKDQLKNLCDSAEEVGLKVIVDVVANHLAGGSSTSFYKNVEDFESQIYKNNLLHTLNKKAVDEDTQSIVQGYIGDFPDLQTESTTVQQRVLSLLKEYIDVGVDGFRFDAAKHIETPDDGKYASNFWPTVLDGATSYAKSKNQDKPFYYGEILNMCGVHRSFSSYTKYMNTIASNQGSDVLAAIHNKNTSKIKQTYGIDVDPTNLILWAESHDTFGNSWGESKDINQSEINKAYVIQASRKSASTLFLARPTSMSSMMGEVCSHAYEDVEIKAINKFHTTFKNKSESISISNGCFVNTRGLGGAAIVSITNTASTNVQVDVPNLSNGSYTDTVTNKKYTVNNGKVTVSLTNGCCVLVGDNVDPGDVPSLNIGTYQEIYSSSQTISVNATGATSMAYKINGGNETAFTGNSLTLPTSISNGLVKVTIIARNSHGAAQRTITLFKTNTLLSKNLIIYNADTSYKYFIWAWGGTSAASWYSATVEGNSIGFDLKDSTSYVLVQFKNTITSPDWEKKEKQTNDYSLTSKLIDFEELDWKNS